MSKNEHKFNHELKKRKKENQKPEKNSDSENDSLKDFEIKKKKVNVFNFPNPDAIQCLPIILV